MTPKWLTITGSLWYGTTVYTRVDIKYGHTICETSIDNLELHEGYIKTPEGNLFNHSNDVKEINCKLVIKNEKFVQVVATRFIHKTEELLINYDIKPHRLYTN